MKIDRLSVQLSEPPPDMPSGIERSMRLEGAVILLVDQDPEYLDAMRLVLRMEGARVHTVVSAKEAVRAVGQWMPNVLLCNLGVADERVHFALRIVHDSPLLKVGIVEGEAALAASHPHDGFYDHVMHKPIDVEALMGQIERALWTLSEEGGPG